MFGTWSLASYSAIDSEVPFEGDDPKPNAPEDWLYGCGREGFAELKPASGISVTIREDGTYSEAKTDADLRLLWFDSKGVQVESPSPTDGVMRQVGNRSFLHPLAAPPGMTRSRDKERELLRYDDGDTLICDQVRLEGAALVRAISVATDELYLNRITAVYKKVQ